MVIKSNNQEYEIYYQGIKGAYSQQAIHNFSKKYNVKVKSMPSKNFSELFSNIEKFGLGMVPIENSTAGSVVECFDLLQKYDVEIIDEINLEIHHCLLGLEESSMDTITQVYSHPQALMQSTDFIEKQNLEINSFIDTAASARFIKESNDISKAAISSKYAASIYGLKIIKENIESIPENTTRFFLVKKRGTIFDFENNINIKDKSTISFETKNIPGALYKSLGALATHNLNLTKIESRPNHKKKFSYTFFVDIDDNLSSNNAKLALNEISFYAHNLKILGEYKSSSQ